MDEKSAAACACLTVKFLPRDCGGGLKSEYWACESCGTRFDKIDRVIASETFENDLRRAINSHSMENGSDTPDFILAQYLKGCLEAYGKAAKAKDEWFGFQPWGEPKPLSMPPKVSP